MLSIFYILQHCNVLQSLGGSFPHHTLVRCPYLPAADNLVHHVQPAQVAQGPGVLCQAAGWEHSSSSPSVLGIPSTVGRVTRHCFGGWSPHREIPSDAEENRVTFPLHSIPGIAAEHQELGITALPGFSPQAGSPKVCATAWAIPRALLCWGVTEQTEFIPNPSLD